MKLTKKQSLFVDNYINPASRCKGNAAESARTAGLTESRGCKLLKMPHIQQAIKQREQEKARVTDWNLTMKIQMAKENFIDSKTPKDKMFWWQELCKLDGSYVIRQEITTEDKTKAQNETIRKEINRVLNIN